jgi:type IV secretion system protein VirB11
MRWHPKRIIFGELRSGIVAKELLECWNTGHSGNLTTIHADTAESIIRRLEGMLREGIQGTIPDIRETIQLLVHLTYQPAFGPVVDSIVSL